MKDADTNNRREELGAFILRSSFFYGDPAYSTEQLPRFEYHQIGGALKKNSDGRPTIAMHSDTSRDSWNEFRFPLIKPRERLGGQSGLIVLRAYARAAEYYC